MGVCNFRPSLHVALNHRETQYLTQLKEVMSGNGVDIVLEMAAHENLANDLEVRFVLSLSFKCALRCVCKKFMTKIVFSVSFCSMQFPVTELWLSLVIVRQ